jgi:hypothetical protein
MVFSSATMDRSSLYTAIQSLPQAADRHMVDPQNAAASPHTVVPAETARFAQAPCPA